MCNISDLELGHCNCIAFKDDRIVFPNHSRGGDVLLAVKNIMSCVRIPVKHIPSIEQVFVSLKYNGINLLLG